MADFNPTQSELPPYVSIRVPRPQAEEIRRWLRWHAEGHAEAHILWATLRNVEQALEKER